MRELAGLQSKQNGRPPHKRVIVLGVVLLCVFVAWVVTMIMGPGFADRP